MRKLIVASVVLSLAWVAVSVTAQDKEKASIKEVMKVAMKPGGIVSKVAEGKATEEEKKKLAGLFAALHENKPPKGEQSSWDSKTQVLVDAANDLLAGKEGAGAKVKAAADCKGCHSAHKGS